MNPDEAGAQCKTERVFKTIGLVYLAAGILHHRKPKHAMTSSHQFVIVARPEHKAAGIIVAAQAAQMVAHALNAEDPEKNWTVVTAPGAAWEVAMELDAENPCESAAS